MRIYAGLILIALFAGWILYRLFIKLDMKQNLSELYVALAFVGAWAGIYWLVA